MTTPVYVETGSRHSGATRIRAPAARGRLALGTIVAWLLALLWPRTAPAADPFAVVLLPDTQQYTISSSVIDHFEAQTQWIVDNADVRNIVFATLVGDIVEHASLALEWNRALGAMDTLDGNLGQNPDGLLPHAAVAGNHDYDVSGVKGAATQYLLHFGPGRYAGRSWYLGAAPNVMSMAQRFSVGGEDYLSLALEWLPSDATLVWAQGVLAAHPDLPTVVTTHEHLQAGTPASYTLAGRTDSASGDNDGESVYRKLIEPFPQVFLVLSGHIPGDGRREDVSALGATVHQVMADYQHDVDGGNGWMQVITLRPDDDEIEFETVSPTYVPGTTAGPDRSLAPESNFLLAFDFSAHRVQLANTTLHFRGGQDFGAGAYPGALDTTIGDGSQTRPDTSYGALDHIVVDGNDDHEQGLLRFDGIVGLGPGQIPPRSTVHNAILTLTTEGSGSQSLQGAEFHRMLAGWNENTTWNDLAGGVLPGSNAQSIATTSSAGEVDNRGTESFDVTPDVQAWVDGEPNYGWALIGNGPDTWTFRSSEWPALAERPMLTVSITPAEVPAAQGPALAALALALGILVAVAQARRR